jgi:hypothetical protein
MDFGLNSSRKQNLFRFRKWRLEREDYHDLSEKLASNNLSKWLIMQISFILDFSLHKNRKQE